MGFRTRGQGRLYKLGKDLEVLEDGEVSLLSHDGVVELHAILVQESLQGGGWRFLGSIDGGRFSDEGWG